jgi:hypothetical protein
MLRTLIAQTNEVDEADIAIIDIMAQLDLNNNLKKNSLGIIFGDISHFDPGLMPALAQLLPFEIVGVNSSLSTGPNHKDDYDLLTLMVLTSDEVNMTVGLSEDFGSASIDSIKDLYRALASKLSNQPKLILMFGSRQSSLFHPDRLIDRLNDMSVDCPIFGCLAGDLDSILEKGFLLYNDRKYMDRVAMVLLDGQIKPKFSLYMIPDNKRLKRKAIITSCRGNIIKKINGLPALDYLKTLGLIMDHKVDFTFNVPLIVERHLAGFWEPILIMKQPRIDYLVCTKDVEENSTLGLAGLDESDVIKSAGALADELKWEHFNFCLIHSCQSRHLSLGLDYLGELERIRSSLSDLLPYAMNYTGGEFCPRVGDQMASTNFFHSLALVCCRF